MYVLFCTISVKILCMSYFTLLWFLRFIFAYVVHYYDDNYHEPCNNFSNVVTYQQYVS